MAESEKYWLGKSPWSASRLRLQFELTKTNFDGHLLDPSIPPPQPGALIADVATGTGTWALDVASKYPEVQIEGLDINSNEVPPKSWLPENVSFKDFDLLNPLPKELEGRYDIVHIEYVIVFVHEQDFPIVLQRLIRMLKPGGWLQWTDSASQKFVWTTASGSSRPPETMELLRMSRDVLAWLPERLWVEELEPAFTEAGLMDVKWVKGGPKVSTLQPVYMDFLWAVQEIRPMLEKKHEKGLLDKYYAQREKAMIEADAEKVGLDMWMVRCVGRNARS